MSKSVRLTTPGSFGVVGLAWLIALAVTACGMTAEEDPGSGTCDPVSQIGCDDPAAPKCSIMPGDEETRVTGCGPAGAIAEGQTCSRTSPGVDDCADGACLALGQPDGERACRHFCRADSDCLMGQRCLYNEGFEFATCMPTCSRLEACPAPTVCHALFYAIATTRTRPLPLLACASVGSGKPGDACTRDSDCEATSVCDPTFHCAQLCDATDACGALTCTSMGDGVSLCQ